MTRIHFAAGLIERLHPTESLVARLRALSEMGLKAPVPAHVPAPRAGGSVIWRRPMLYRVIWIF